MELQNNRNYVFTVAKERTVQCWKLERTAILLSLAFHAFGPLAMYFAEVTYGAAFVACLLLALPKIRSGAFLTRALKNIGIFMIMFVPGWAVFLIVHYSSASFGLPLISDARHDPGFYVMLFAVLAGVPALLIGILLCWLGGKLNKGQT